MAYDMSLQEVYEGRWLVIVMYAVMELKLHFLLKYEKIHPNVVKT